MYCIRLKNKSQEHSREIQFLESSNAVGTTAVLIVTDRECFTTHPPPGGGSGWNANQVRAQTMLTWNAALAPSDIPLCVSMQAVNCDIRLHSAVLIRSSIVWSQSMSAPRGLESADTSRQLSSKKHTI
jgi:hypothetical protein